MTLNSARTLLLTQGYEPLSTISWQRAISLLTLGKVEVVEEYDHLRVRSMQLVIKLPAVVRLVQRLRRRHHRQPIKFSRHNVLARDGWTCQYCGRRKPTPELTYDHVVPRSQGGQTCWDNIVTACVACNARKANRTPQQAEMRLLAQPSRPSWVPVFIIRLSGPPPDQWASYLYWNSELTS